LILTPFAPTTFTPVPERVNPDLNHDGWSDLVWRHMGTGQNAVWLMNGARAASTPALSPANAARVADLTWEIRAVGDMNRDGDPDLIWQNRTSGQTAVWFLSGTTLIGTDFVYQADGHTTIEADRDWKIVAAGDIDRDGNVDLIWRHRVSGAVRAWHMKGNVEWDSVPFATVSDAAWEINGLADLNGDGMLDLVWRHYGTGGLAVWYLYDTLLQQTVWMSPSEYTALAWHVVGVADMNADARPDLVWQNFTTGELGVWFMNGITRIGGQYLNPSSVNPAWRIVGVK
jgi:hypothetical protein